MRRAFLVPAVSVWLAAAPAVGAACGASPQQTFQQFIAAFNALDWPVFHSCFADSVSLFNPEVSGAASLHRLDGRTEVERSYRGIFDVAAADSTPSRGPHIVPEHLQMQQFGDAAVLSFEFKRAAGSFGRRTIVMARQADGWRIVHIHASNVKP